MPGQDVRRTPRALAGIEGRPVSHGAAHDSIQHGRPAVLINDRSRPALASRQPTHTQHQVFGVVRTGAADGRDTGPLLVHLEFPVVV